MSIKTVTVIIDIRTRKPVLPEPEPLRPERTMTVKEMLEASLALERQTAEQENET